MLCLVVLVTLLLPFLLFPLILCIRLSVYVLLSFLLIPCCLSFVYFSLLVTFLIYLFAFVNLLISLFILCTSSCVYFFQSQFVSFKTFSSIISSLFLDLFLYLFIYLFLCVFLLSFPSLFISSAFPVQTKLYAAVYWLRTPPHSLPLKMHYCVTELNWYCPGLFVHNIVLEFEF